MLEICLLVFQIYTAKQLTFQYPGCTLQNMYKIYVTSYAQTQLWPITLSYYPEISDDKNKP